MYSKRYLAKRAFYEFQTIISTFIYPYYKSRDFFVSNNLARILCYHSISNFPLETKIPYDNLAPNLFSLQMQVLKDECYNVILLSELVGIIRQNQNIPKGTIVITFDDGYRNNFLNALPVLEKHNFKATFFVIAEQIGMTEPFKHLLWDQPAKDHFLAYPESRLPMDEHEICRISDCGHQIGSHGLTHRSIGNLPRGEARKEIIQSKEILEEMLKKKVFLFSYPFGARNYNDFNSQTSDILIACGFEAACTSDIGAVSEESFLYELPRIPVRETDSPFRFKQKIMGCYDWVDVPKNIFQKHLGRIDHC
jgi:peptidoglycan/xylan/chitin deacetylase (PgdA/CDA1 family)